MLTWEDIFKEKTKILNHNEEEPILKIMATQFESFRKKNAPKIADPEIKSIPIEESNDPLVDIVEMNHPRIKMLPTPSKPFEAPDKSSGYTCESKVRKKVFEKLTVMLEKMDILAKKFGYEPKQIIIRVFEGLRNFETQSMLFKNKQQEISLAHPDWKDTMVFEETSKWVSPVIDNIPVHSTGGAVDIRLWDEKNEKFLDMGIFGVIWGTNNSAPTFSEEITDIQKNNRLLAYISATQAGLTNYLFEYWHFSYKDKYAEYWREENKDKRKSEYGMK